MTATQRGKFVKPMKARDHRKNNLCFPNFPRYETKTFSSSSNNDPSSINDGFTNMTISSDGNSVRVTDTGSNRLQSMTQRVMERKTVTTSSESRMEKQNKQHSYRLE